MARYTALRGNPETKLMVINTDFSGGLNVMFSDDLTRDSEMRYLLNYDLENTGEMRSRKGFAKSNALSQLITSDATDISKFPIITETASPVKEIILFKILQNDNNAWRRLSDYPTLAAFQADYGAEANVIKIFILAKLADDSTKYWFKTYTINELTAPIVTVTGTLPIVLNKKDNLLDVVTGEQYGKLFLTANTKGLVEIDTVANTFKYIGEFGTGITNSAYKPNGIEVRRVGFNVLGKDPLTWIDNKGLTINSIQGVYITTTDRIPLMAVPTGMKLQINIIYTGNFSDFDIVFSEYETPLDASVTKNTTVSTTGIAVYDVDFLTQPSTELQINIAFTEPSITLEDYIDYYPVGVLDTSAPTVETLDIGNFEIVQIYDRLVFYKGNQIWFSEINNFVYVPNFNFVLLPIDNTDEVVKITYFRTSYIVFTKKKIYKLSGSFGSTTLRLDLVNDDVGCIAPNSVVLVENELFFLSTRGLRSLKTDIFRESVENLRQFDERVYPIVTNNANAYAFVYKEQYLLFSNLRGNRKYVTVRERRYEIPDVLRAYYRLGAYSMDKLSRYPRFIIQESGELYSFMTINDVTSIYKFGQGYNDFGATYDCEFETTGMSMGYPTHEKKFKHVIFKIGGQLNHIYVDTFADGYNAHSEEITSLTRDEDVELGGARYTLNKERLPSKCRNFAVRVKVKDAKELFVQSLAYVFKLGKVREF
jgi:hypothetical protein